MKVCGSARIFGAALFFSSLLMQASAVRAQTPLDPVISQVAVGESAVCALTSSGAAKCWGDNQFGQLGNNSNITRTTPIDVFGLASGIIEVATGGYHSCALTSIGGVKCWGQNDDGQLGNNDQTFASSTVPVAVTDSDFVPITGAAAIALGRYHSCALMASGNVLCWGNNGAGQLGNNDPGFYGSSFPVTVVVDAENTPLAGVVAIAAGRYHTCALLFTGAMYCWGENNNGELGSASVESQSTVALGVVDADDRPIAAISAIAAGAFHTCAATRTGGAKCWGFDGAGELGNHSTFNGPDPVPSPVVDSSDQPVSGLATIAAGTQHTCARTSAGGAKCWGYNGYGELGAPQYQFSSVPAAVVDAGNVPISNVASLVAGGFNSCALSRVGGVACWGDDSSGKNGTGALTRAPAVVLGLTSGIQAAANGQDHSCALTLGGGVVCWGGNGAGQLGNNSTLPTGKPVAVSGLGGGVTAIGAGSLRTCALVSGGVKCWGDNSFGALGNNNPAMASSPIPVTVVDAGNVPIAGVVAIAVGKYHACAALTSGVVKCWGANFSGQLGNNDSLLARQAAAVSVVDSSNVPITGVSSVAAGFGHTCARTIGGGALCWGDNTGGILGNNNLAVARSLTPVSVVDGSNVPVGGIVSVAAGYAFTCARTTTNGVKCWGDNSYNSLGSTGNGYSAVPLDVVDDTLAPLGGVVAMSTGTRHSCAALGSGAVRCWGANYFGELANPTVLFISGSAVPALNPNGSPVGGMATVAAGGDHTCAVTNSGAVQCWGSNIAGQVGNGAIGQLPSAVIGLSGSVAAITTGDSHTCARTPAGTIKCWGYNFYGQLGNNDNTGAHQQTPVSVLDASSRVVTGLSDVAAGADHTCAVTPGGGVQCWGDNSNGQLGNNDNSGANRLTPVAVVDAGNVPIAGIAAVTAGAFHSCALTSAGRILCWGDNSNGQLGNNDNTLVNKYTAVSVVDATNTAVTGATALASGGYFTCGLFTGGAVKCWGDNSKAQLGMGTSGGQSLIPVAATNLGSGVASIAAGVFHACAVTAAGAAKCWGYNADGELGDNSTATPQPTPSAVSGLGSGVAKIAAGQFHTCAASTAGALTCWGDNSKGQLGINVVGGRSLVPVGVNGLGSGIAAAAAGGFHTCALTTSGAITCWGNNNVGQVGDNSTSTRAAPVGVLNGQSIAFAPPAAAAIGTLTLSATASSGLAVTFDSWTPSICTVSGNKVTISAFGLCGVRAAQSGNGSTIAAAPRQSRLIVASNEIFGDGFE
jgi:alpha-tubulin suppressor-like RCC1 family protein